MAAPVELEVNAHAFVDDLFELDLDTIEFAIEFVDDFYLAGLVYEHASVAHFKDRALKIFGEAVGCGGVVVELRLNSVEDVVCTAYI